ncbi:MAG TPA: antirestriction protein ArdA [Rhizobiales bacterium]|nr:antirestriction protein ArdA [Hyphomicrobiales bacterium]
MTTFFAQPYDISATGFYFEDTESYEAKIGSIRNDYGDLVEEFEIQTIDGDLIDIECCKAIGINQANIIDVMLKLDEWDEYQKRNIILAVGECGYAFDAATSDPDDFDIDIYDVSSLRALAEHFVDEGLFGEIPDALQCYIDHDAITRDLGMDYTEATVAGEAVVYRCG